MCRVHGAVMMMMMMMMTVMVLWMMTLDRREMG